MLNAELKSLNSILTCVSSVERLGRYADYRGASVGAEGS